MADISWDKLNYNFSFVVVDICLIKIGTYIFKVDAPCFFKLQSTGTSVFGIHIDATLVLFISTIFYVYAYYSENVIKNGDLTRNKRVYLFCVSFVLGFFFTLLSEYIVELSSVLLLLATTFFLISLYSIIKILFIEDHLTKEYLTKCVVASIIVIAVSIGIEISAGASCWKI